MVEYVIVNDKNQIVDENNSLAYSRLLVLEMKETYNEWYGLKLKADHKPKY